MKKILSILIVLVISFSSFAASEPLVTLSTVLPAVLYMDEMEAEYDMSEQYSRYSMFSPLAIPFLVADSELSFYDIFSDSFIDKAKSAYEAVTLFSSVSDMRAISCRGILSFEPSVDLREGEAAISVIYDDIALLYSSGGWTDTGYIDGRAGARVKWNGKPLVTLSVFSDTTLSDHGTVELSLYLDEKKVDEFIGFIGVSREELWGYGIETAFQEFHPDLLSYILGFDVEIADQDEIVKALEASDMLDILSFLGLVWLSSDAITMCVVPHLTIDGAVPDIDIGKLMKDAVRLVNLADSFL